MSYPEDELVDLAQRVARLERQVALLMETLGIEYPEESSPSVSPEVAALVRSGRKIRAIQQYRRETGAGLKAAKAFIESLDL